MTENLGDVLVAFRARSGLSQQELAERAGLSVRAVRDIERGRVRAPHARSLRRLANVVGLDLASNRLRADVVRVDVLGPLVVRRGVDVVEVLAPMQRRLLGLLALNANTAVSADEIFEVLWPSGASPGARSLVQTHVARLRKALGESVAIVRVGSGYRLALGVDQCDLLEFDGLVAGGAPGDALDLWRGSPLTDIDELRQHPSAVAAAHRRIAAARDCADRALAAGDARTALDRLRRVAQDEPLNEGISARIMLALAATGERAAALRLYRDLREQLVESLGIEPGPELADAHLAILRQRPQEPAVPRQLPRDIASFTGRERQLAALDALLDADAATPIAVISGPAGVGKTALAVRWAHRVRDRFPDGQLVVDLRGGAAGDPLGPLLRALGVPASGVPFDLAAQVALFRSTTAGLRLLLFVDGATRADQVRPLIPAGPGCAVVVTSRGGLPGLRASDDAIGVPLDLLDPEESVALLRRLLTGTGTDEATLSELARLCAHLPLALRVAAANITGLGPGAAADYAAALATGNRLRELTVGDDGETAVQTAFELSYATLDPASARAFRALGLVPGVDVTSRGVAALLDVDQAAAARALDRLVSADLVQRRARDRYRFHDLLRLFAEEKGRAVDPGHERDRARLRLYRHYVATADWATAELYPGMLRMTPLPRGVEPDRVTDPARWLEVERTNLVATAVEAAEHGPREVAWQLADVLRGHQWRTHDVAAWLAVGHAGLRAARAAEDLQAVAAMEYVVGNALRRMSGPERPSAADRFATAAALFAALGHRRAEAAALDSLGMLHHDLGDVGRATDALLSSLAICRAERFDVGLTRVLCNLGLVSVTASRLDDAQRYLSEALNLSRAIGEQNLEAMALHNFGHACRVNGDTGGALDTLRYALVLHDAVDDLEGKAMTLDELATTLHTTGDPTALDHWHEALAIYEKLEHRQTADLRRRVVEAQGVARAGR